jgi:hypothetical protein
VPDFPAHGSLSGAAPLRFEIVGLALPFELVATLLRAY